MGYVGIKKICSVIDTKKQEGAVQKLLFYVKTISVFEKHVPWTRLKYLVM
jgi:hypothetical protein